MASSSTIRRFHPDMRQFLQESWHWLVAARERSRQRQALGALSDTMLKDIGLTRADIQPEIRKPFWRI